MGMMKQYFLRLLEAGDTSEEQQAIETALRDNWIHLSYRLKVDQSEILRNKTEWMKRWKDREGLETKAQAGPLRAKKTGTRGRGAVKRTGIVTVQVPEVRSKKLNREKASDARKRTRLKAKTKKQL
jgi:hypothetical protein